jgi:hypothetical protein
MQFYTVATDKETGKPFVLESDIPARKGAIADLQEQATIKGLQYSGDVRLFKNKHKQDGTMSKTILKAKREGKLKSWF